MTADEDQPVADALRAWYRESDVAIDEGTGISIAVYASFLALGVGLGALLTVRLLVAGDSGAAVDGTLRIPASHTGTVLSRILVGVGLTFAGCHAIVLAWLLRGEVSDS